MSNTAAPDSFRERIANMLADRLDSEHVSDDHFDICFKRQMAALRCREFASAAPTNQAHRRIALHFIRHATLVAHVPRSCWFRAADAFDCASTRSDEGNTIDRTLAQAAAALLACWKNEEQREGWLHLVDFLVGQATAYSVNCGGANISRDAVCREEHNLLIDSPIGICSPTVHCWFHMVSRRFNLVTSHTCCTVIEVASKWAGPLAVVGVLQAAAARDNCPLVRASGLLALALTIAGIVPLDVLRPCRVSSEWWDLAFVCARSQPGAEQLREQGSAIIGATMLNGSAAVAALEFASRLPVSSLSAGAWVALELICNQAMRGDW